MTTEGARSPIHLAADGGGREWPLAVPRELFTVYQPAIGGLAVLTWLNLYEISGRDDVPGDVLAETARRIGVDASALDETLTVLERAGLLERAGAAFALRMPGSRIPGAVSAVQPTSTAAAATDGEPSPPAAAVPSPTQPSMEPASPAGADDGGLGAVVAFYHQRIGVMGPSQFEKLRFWLEEMGMSPDVIALAIEETVQNAKSPRMNYLEAVLRNWYNDGVRTVADLQRSRQARATALPQRSEGSPNAAAYETIDPDAVRRWKEMYADEYDG